MPRYKGDKVSIFDPIRQAYFEVDIETAKKYIAAAKDAEHQIRALEQEVN